MLSSVSISCVLHRLKGARSLAALLCLLVLGTALAGLSLAENGLRLVAPRAGLVTADTGPRGWITKLMGFEHHAAQTPRTAAFRQTVRIWVHADRVSPDVIYVRPGKLKLEAENETGLDVNLRFERQILNGNNQLQGAVRTTAKAKRADLEVELGAGEYVFYDEARPAIKGKLIVDPAIGK